MMMRASLFVLVAVLAMTSSCRAHKDSLCGTHAPPPTLEAIAGLETRDATTPCYYLAASPCYNSTVRNQYLAGLPGSFSKPVRLVVHVPRRSDGTRPPVDANFIAGQVETLRLNWLGVNAHPDPIIHYVDDDALWAALVETSPLVSSCGDGHCDANYPASGWDCGDCAYRTDYKDLCTNAQVKNGVCDPECNTPFHQWDGGDCCLDSAPLGRCIDPSSSNSVVTPFGGWKEAMLDGLFAGDEALHVFVVSRFYEQRLGGIGTFPFDSASTTSEGGLMMVGYYRGQRVDDYLMAHESGHCVGLFHSFTGVSESWCDPCSENVNTPDRNAVGDFCADTLPMPRYQTCAQPPAGDEDCDGVAYVGYPDTNIMSYANCDSQAFTQQQRALSACFLDRQLRTWLGAWSGAVTTPPPTPPAGWTCDAQHYGSHDGCHCNCGAADPDCSDSRPAGTQPAVFGCSTDADVAGCSASGQCLYRSGADAVPAAWTCPVDWYNAADGCDCSCGAADPDCQRADNTALYGCAAGTGGSGAVTCSAQGACLYADKTATPSWQCPADSYNAGDGCDCNCGDLDPDCLQPSADVFNCPSGYTCSARGNCEPPQPGANWQCNPDYYAAFDGCDCGCGNDPDCADAVEQFIPWGCSTTFFQYCNANDVCEQISSLDGLLSLSNPNNIGCRLPGHSDAADSLCVVERNGGVGLYTCVDKQPNYLLAVVGANDADNWMAINSDFAAIGSCQVSLTRASGFIIGADMTCNLAYDTAQQCKFHYSPAAALLPALVLAAVAAIFVVVF